MTEPERLVARLYVARETEETRRRLAAFARECIVHSGGNPEPVCADCGSDLDGEGRCKAGCDAARRDVGGA